MIVVVDPFLIAGDSLFDQETGRFAVFQAVFDTQKHGLLVSFIHLMRNPFVQLACVAKVVHMSPNAFFSTRQVLSNVLQVLLLIL